MTGWERVLEIHFDAWGLTVHVGPLMLVLVVVLILSRSLGTRDGSRCKA